MKRVKDRVAVVTGAARGNGEGISRVLAREGAIVVMTDVLSQVAETSDRIRNEGGRTMPFQADVTDVASIERLVEEVISRFERIDILVNNAGIVKAVPFVDMTNELRDQVFNVNINGVWNWCKAVIPTMLKNKHGRVINISSVTGPMVANYGESAYATSKGAVCAFTKALALEVARSGITVNAVCPGYFDTPMVRQAAREMAPDNPQMVIDKRSKSIPVGRFGITKELGELVCFLASEESQYITGTTIVIDGGGLLPEAGCILY